MRVRSHRPASVFVVRTRGASRRSASEAAWARRIYHAGRDSVVAELRGRTDELADASNDLDGRRRRQVDRDVNRARRAISGLEQRSVRPSERGAARLAASADRVLDGWLVIRMDTARVQRQLVETLAGLRASFDVT